MRKWFACVGILMLMLSGCRMEETYITTFDQSFLEKFKDMTYSEAVKVVENKVSKNSLTDEERMAHYLYLTHENALYLAAQEEGYIGAFSEKEDTETTVCLNVYTTEEAVGARIFEQHPLKFEDSETEWSFQGELNRVETFDEGETPNFHYFRILGKQEVSSESYLENLALFPVNHFAKISATITLQSEEGRGACTLSEEMIRRTVLHYLSIEPVVWVELSYEVEDAKKDPTLIHSFWKNQEEMPYHEAQAIVIEKVTKRFDERLTDRERMAAYVYIKKQCEKIFPAESTPKYLAHYSVVLNTTESGIGTAPLSDYNLDFEVFGAVHLICKDTAFEGKVEKIDDVKRKELQMEESGESSLLTIYPKGGYFEMGFEIMPESAEGNFNNREVVWQIIRQYLSIDCVTWIDFSAHIGALGTV